MDDDIDIEEHDVLDNPAIKTIFPDLSILKKEISFYDDQAIAIKSDPDVILIDPIDPTRPETSTDQDLNFKNSCFEEEDIKMENDLMISEDTQPSEKPPFVEGKLFFQNKIILGSKPNQKSTYKENSYEQNSRLYYAKICLRDIRFYLDKSGRFCSACHIFFSQKRDLDNHNKDVHEREKDISNTIKPISVLRHRCEKCMHNFASSANLKKHLRNVHHQKFFNIRKSRPDKTLRRSSTVVNKSKSVSNSRCFHCKKIFSSQKNLIEHIYNVLQTTNLNEHTQLRLMERKKKIREAYMTQYKHNNFLNKRKNIEDNQVIEPRKKSSAQKNIRLHKCYYCSYYLRDEKLYRTHLAEKHKDSDMISGNKVIFDPHCKFCSLKLGNIKIYNSHLHYRHAEMVNKTFKIQPKICLTRIEYVLAGKQCPAITQGSKPNNGSQPQDNLPYSNEDEENNTSKIKSQKNEVGLRSKFKKSIKSVIQKNKIKINEDMVNENEAIKDFIDIEQNELVLKGILFRCKRCDIHFLTSRCAMNHSQHMEMLINWKCSICLKIFKKHDECLHIQQHAFSDEFVVYELSESKLSRVLYKCPKCAIHFNDEKYAYHFKLCGKIVTESTYCNACDILLEKSVMLSHEYEHNTNNQSLADFTIVTSDIIIPSPYNNIIKKEINTLCNKIRLPGKKNTKKVDTLKMSYCNICQCFVSHVLLRTVHIEGRCSHMVKHVCKYCGLVLTNQTMKTHRKRHHVQKDLKLQDFKFYDMKTNKRILPPIPEYPKCNICDVHFLSKMLITNHVCNENDFLTCPICDIKLSDEVFKLHLSFHHYSLNRSTNNVQSSALMNEPEFSKSDMKSKCLQDQKCSRKLDKICESGNVGNVTFTSIDNVERNIKRLPKSDELNQTTQSKQVPSMEHSKMLLMSGSKSARLSIAEKDKSVLPSVHNTSVEEKNDLELSGVFYCCSYCYITLVKFDHAVEHCQDHYCNEDRNAKILTCAECNMKYDRIYYEDHKKIHDLQKSDKTFKVLKFDAVYFAVDYKLWIQNLFETLEPELRKSILHRSIYKCEGRVKLTVIQKGVSDITVYKCDVCRMFVDPDAILSHVENSCFRLKKNICSFCGLAFVSHVSRMSHEEIHEHNTALTVNKFKIVIFNQNTDKEYNKNIINSRNNFIFFQCRRCYGLFERFQCRLHDCNKLNFKECPICRFLVYNSSYKSHMMKHALIINFTHNNMKIIRFGKYDGLNTASSGLPSKFSGVVKDYTFYKCLRCDLHIKKSQSDTVKHDCLDDSAKILCSKCNIFFLRKQINQHNKLHDSDPYFNQVNFNLLPITENDIECIDSLKDICSNIKPEIKIKENVCIKEQSLVCNNPSSTIVRVVKIYKCDCMLSFLDKVSIESHFGHCKSKTIKQTCTKCSLVFTPKDLFTHLVKHHGDKKYLYKFNVIQMNQHKRKVIELYNCSLCNLHFVECESAKKHFDNCLNSITEGNKCEHCKLFFEKSCIQFHESHHHSSDVVDFDVVDLKGETHNSNENILLDKEIQDMTLRADAVFDKTYKMSEESLSQISLNSYSNTIYKCIECNAHFLTEHTFRLHLHKDCHGTCSTDLKDCEICGLSFSLQSLTKHIYVHHNQMNLELPNITIKSGIDDVQD